MDFRGAVDFVGYLEGNAYNPRIRRKLGELRGYLISLKRANNRLRGVV